MKKLKYDVSHEDTCMQNWLFDIEENGSEKIIRSVDIEFDRRGCMGHPKTIAALVTNRSVDSINTDLLAKTACARGKSCGMILGECLEKIQKS